MAERGTSQAFPLVVTEGEKRFVFKFEDEGVALDETGLRWAIGVANRSRPYREIVSIRLRVMPTPGEPTGQCTLMFSDATILNVMSWTPAGFADAERAKHYRAFVGALHARLDEAERARIAFAAGFPGANATWTRVLGTIALVAAALLFIAAPLGVALIAGDPKGYALAFGGTLMFAVLFWKVRSGRELNAANAPRRYPPGDIPPELLP